MRMGALYMWWSCCHQLCSFSVFVVGSPLVSVVHIVAHRTIREVLQTPYVQLEDLQHCCLGECCLKIQFREVSEESVVHLFDFIRMVSSCDSYDINVLGWPKYLAPPSLSSIAECTDSTSIQVCPFSRNFSTRLCTESLWWQNHPPLTLDDPKMHDAKLLFFNSPFISCQK